MRPSRNSFVPRLEKNSGRLTIGQLSIGCRRFTHSHGSLLIYLKQREIFISWWPRMFQGTLAFQSIDKRQKQSTILCRSVVDPKFFKLSLELQLASRRKFTRLIGKSIQKSSRKLRTLMKQHLLIIPSTFGHLELATSPSHQRRIKRSTQLYKGERSR